MQFNAIRRKYIEFFMTKAGHRQIPAAPLIPPDDPTTLFTSSGMQQLVPFLKGAIHPMGERLVDSQPSFRAEDIEEVGDNRHTTMFEMLGNWSLGDYFKAEQLPWFFTFLTQEIKLDPERLYVTVFAGDKVVPKDEESIAIWQKLFETDTPAREGSRGFDPGIKIYTYPAKKNWWSRAGIPENMPPGEIGGPDSEVFYDFDPGEKQGIHANSQFSADACHVNCDCGRFLEIGNSVFMQYEKQADGSFKPLPKQNVDFGGGLERITAASQNTPDVFMIDIFKPIIEGIEQSSGKKYQAESMPPMRVIADHLRASVMMIGQGLEPSNKMQGYVLRRLLRRAVVKVRDLGGDAHEIFRLSIPAIVTEYAQAGFISQEKSEYILSIVDAEVIKFSRALNKWVPELEKFIENYTQEVSKDRGMWVANAQKLAKVAYDYYQSYGVPIDVSLEKFKPVFITLGWENDSLMKEEFEKLRKEHIEKSRTASAGMFKGGLADHSADVTKLHTATHLLQKSLQIVLGSHVRQEGSNITAERLRFDYFTPKAPTEAELRQVEVLMNQKIQENLPVTKTIEDKEQAVKSGAMAFFKETYPEKVSVYTIGKDHKNDWFSKELCGGPHVASTSEIGAVTIKKDKSIGANTRRIYVELC